MKFFITLVNFVNNERDTYKSFLLATIFNTDILRLATLVKDPEWELEILEIGFDYYVFELASNETFHIKNTEDE